MPRQCELVEPRKEDRRYVGRSLSQDRRRKAKTEARPGQGQGERPRKS